ncbi:MAG: 4-hydroxy-tetrahydrodipicolinate reductase [Clostridia bacterium]|nr:4-hydroxy-tetrahydrodipicolinate reductase [Clostridia bacterium]
MIRAIVHGAGGRMGKELLRLINESEDFTLAAAVDKFGGENVDYKSLSDCNTPADVIIDFSNHVLTKELCEYAVERNIPVVIATTGQDVEEREIMSETAKKIPVFHSANMSVGIAALASLAKKAAQMFPDADIEIIEKHHNRKLDAPSGTALLLARELKEVRTDAEFVLGRSGNAKREKNEIGICAVRAGNIVGDHEIIICTDSQTLTLRHEAHDRALFAEGAISAARYLVRQEKPGMYDMKNMMA